MADLVTTFNPPSGMAYDEFHTYRRLYEKQYPDLDWRTIPAYGRWIIKREIQ